MKIFRMTELVATSKLPAVEKKLDKGKGTNRKARERNHSPSSPTHYNDGKDPIR